MRPVKAKCGVLNYQACEHILCLRGDVCRNIAVNTWLQKGTEGGETVYCVVFHHTPIIAFYQDGSVQLRTHGHRTMTTKQRIWQFSGFQCFSLNHQWYIRGVGKFLEGICIDKYGNMNWLRTLNIKDCPIDYWEPLIAADWLEDHNRPQEADALRAALNDR